MQIVGLHSELIALSCNGQLYQWRWGDVEPYRHPEVQLIIFKNFVCVCLPSYIGVLVCYGAFIQQGIISMVVVLEPIRTSS